MAEIDNDKWEVEETEIPQEEEADVKTYQINYYPTDLTLKGYLEKWNNKQLFVPPFQRNYVWDQVQASKLIESYLLGLPVPGVFLYKERKTNKLQIIDGQQRILSTVRFFTNDFDGKPFRLKNVLPKWEGKRYDDLEEAEKFLLDDSVLRATVVQQLDPDDDSSIFHIFERLNTGGMKLSPMEIRKCLFLSDFYYLLEELNKFETWRKLIGKPVVDKRLRDLEFILRILALNEHLATYEKPMKQFLNSYMTEKMKLEEKDLKKFINETRRIFRNACDYTFKQLGEKPFHIRGRLNYAVLDSTMSTSFLASSMKIPDFNKRFKRLVVDKDYLDFVTANTSDDKAVTNRFLIANKILTQ